MSLPPLSRTTFVYGSGRSGTTMLAKLFDASPEVIYRHEPDKIRKCPDLPFLPEPSTYQELNLLARDYLRLLVRESAASVSGKRPQFPKSFRTRPSDFVREGLLLPFLQASSKLGIHIPVPDLATNGAHCVIKSVNSLCRVPLFATAAPEVRFVHIVRHPGAVIASLLRGIKRGLMERAVYIEDVAMLSNATALGASLGHLKSLSYEEQVAWMWLIQNDKSHRELRYYERYRIVSYEQLCVDPAGVMRELCTFAGITFDTQITRFIDSMAAAKDDGGYFSVAKNPTAGIDRWETELSRELKARIDAVLMQAEVGRLVMARYRDACQEAKASSAGR